MTTLYAQPYDISTVGFYFTDIEGYEEQVSSITNQAGDPVEEFDIQFIDGEKLDCELAKAMDLSQANLHLFLIWVDEWEDYEKIRFIIAVGECGYLFDADTDPDKFDIDVYEESSLKDLAYALVDEGLFGDIPDNLQCYLDYDAIACDLEMDYTETVIAGQPLMYRCG